MEDIEKKEPDNPNNSPKGKIINKIDMKNYRVPDASNKKGFEKINNYNFIKISKFLSFLEIAEASFVNKKFNILLNRRYSKRFPAIKASISIFKKNIFIKFPEDFRFYLEKNSLHIKEVIKKIIESLDTEEYFNKLGAKKYFFSKKDFNSSTITKIFLNNCEIGKKSMKYLSYYLSNPKCQIKDIDISRSKINGEILRPIESVKKLELDSLIANKCIIDIKTLGIISNIKVKKLSLVNNNIDNESISKLESSYIEELNLSNNSISNDGMLNICKNMPNLTKLNLSNNNLCDSSIVYICIYIKRSENKLISLNLKDNKITLTGMMTLMTVLDYKNKQDKNSLSIKRLNLSGNLLDYVPIPERLGTNFLNIKLEKLCLSNHCFNINDLNILFNFINNIKTLKILDLSKTVFDNVSLNLLFNRVSENTTLIKLKLNNCYLGNTEMNNSLGSYYSKNNANKEINNNNINNPKNENENGNEIILNKAEKSESIIHNEYLGVESLDLGYNFINYKQLDNIILSNNIKELNIEGNDLHLWGNDLNIFFDSIIKNKVLEKLNLNNNNLQKFGNVLLEKLYNFNNDNNSNCFLKHLSLEDNQIKDIKLELTNLLGNNKNLEVLNLRQNLINDEIGNNYFFHSLFKNKSSNLKEINISDNKISLDFIEKIIKYSQENKIEKNDFIFNITSKEMREAYLNNQNKSTYWEINKLNCIKCL